VNVDKLNDAIKFHDSSVFTTSHGGALVIVYKGHIIGESYVTGTEGGPQPWTPRTCNAVASSTKSVFGTAVGVFLEEYKNRVNLESYLVGESRDDSLIPQIWDQPITDERKKKIQVKHVLSMTSGHEGDEPWRATNPRRHYPGYSGAFQMFEYCFGWWYFEGIPAHHTLSFDPGYGFKYSNFGMEQLTLAMRNISGEELGPYVYDRVLGKIGLPIGIRDNRYRHVPEPNFSDEPGWGIGGSEGCDAYGTDKSKSPYGYNSLAGASFRCNGRDFARLGYLWLNKGRWGRQQLVPEEWMKQATRRFKQANGESPRNYGYTFWIQDEWENVPKDTFSSRGFKRNDCHVIPSLDLVVARLGNSNPPRGQGGPFTESYIEKIVAAIPAKV
jgi:CubicO group peptidase (beta-lactamase class C family)